MSLTGLAFLLFYATGLGLAFVRGPIWGLWTYMAVFYLHPPSRWWGVGLPSIRWALLAAVVSLVAFIIYNARTRPQRVNDTRPTFFSQRFAVLFALFVCWMWIQVPWVFSPYHVEGTVLFTKYLLLIYLIYNIVRTPEQIRDTLLVHIFGCLYLGWLAYQAGGGGRLEGVGGPGIDDSNSMAMQLGTAVIAGAALMLREKIPRMAVVLVAMPFILNGMILGNSRGAFLGLVAGGIVMWWLKPASARARFFSFGALGVCLFLMLAHEFFWERISTLGAITNEQQELDNSALSRFAIVDAQFEMFFDHPLGVGHKGTAVLSPDYIDAKYLTVARNDPTQRAARSSHNTFMSVLVDQGLFGAILFFLIAIWVLQIIRKCRTSFRQQPNSQLLLVAVAGALCVVVVSGLFAPYLKAEVQYWMLSLLMCVAGLRSLDDTSLEQGR